MFLISTICRLPYFSCSPFLFAASVGDGTLRHIASPQPLCSGTQMSLVSVLMDAEAVCRSCGTACGSPIRAFKKDQQIPASCSWFLSILPHRSLWAPEQMFGPSLAGHRIKPQRVLASALTAVRRWQAKKTDICFAPMPQNPFVSSLYRCAQRMPQLRRICVAPPSLTGRDTTKVVTRSGAWSLENPG